MPFLLLDDAATEATRRLQDFGNGLLQPLQPLQGVGQSVQDITTGLQNFGQQQLQSLSQQTQPVGRSVQDITQGLQDFGQQQLQNVQQAKEQAVSQVNAVQAQPPLASMTQPDPSEQEQYIRQAAQQRGIDPDTAVAVARSEGLNTYVGDNNSSFGPFQLHYGGVAPGGNAVSGLGDTFTARTGLDARDPSTWKQQVDFALDQVKQGGWGPWHGAAAQGITGMQGVGAAPSTAPQTQGQGQTVFPVQGYQGDIADHWGSVKGGSDIMAPRGTPVVAMRGGKVVESGWNDVGGNSVLIQADDGNQYYYAHLDSAPQVQVGQNVTAGTYLGPVGNTGDAKGGPTHLHIGIGPSILLGADKYGGTGGDFDAVDLLRQAQAGGGQHATNTAAGPQALAPPTPQAIADAGSQALNTLGQAKDRALQILGQPDLAQQLPSTRLANAATGQFLPAAQTAYEDWAARNRAAVQGVPLLGGAADLTQKLADTSSAMGAALATLPIGGLELEGPATAGMTRMFHGTAADFPKVSPEAVGGGENLFGPGYYLTSDPRVAGGVVRNADVVSPGYAQQRGPSDVIGLGDVDNIAAALERVPSITPDLARTLAQGQRGASMAQGEVKLQQLLDALQVPRAAQRQILNTAFPAPATGPNVRAVDVPQDLNLLNVDAPADPGLIQRARQLLGSRWDDAESFFNFRNRNQPPATNDQVLEMLRDAAVPEVKDIGAEALDINGPAARAAANRVLSELGYDGITYAG